MAGATDVFERQGIGPATVQQVLEQAGVSRRTFYQYFSGKEDVLAAVYEDQMDALLAHFAGGIQGTTDPAQKVVDTIDLWLGFQIENGTLLASLQLEAARPDSQLHRRREGFIDVIVHTIDTAVQETLGVQVDPLVFRGLVLGVQGVTIHLTLSGRLEAERARIRRVVGGMFFAVLAGVSQLPDPPRQPAVDDGSTPT